MIARRVPAVLEGRRRSSTGTSARSAHFPLWCVPYKRVHDYEWLDDSFYAGMKDELFLDLAIYGMEQPDGATSTG